MLTVEGLKTRVFELGEPILPFVFETFESAPQAHPPLENGDILCVTSKVISLSEKRVVQKKDINKKDINKKELIKGESDHYLADGPFGVSLTIKHGLMIASAGIDESNAAGDFYILYPTDPFASAKNIHEGLKERFGLKNLGVILTDSHTQPLRRGVTGVALSYWGFKGIQSFVGREDLFGRKLKFTCAHVADALAGAAVLEMGESNEAKCLARIRGAQVQFQDEIDRNEGIIAPEDDLYYSLYKSKIQKP